MIMGRDRQHDKHLPRRMYLRRGKYYFVDAGGRWHPLGAELAAAMAKYGELIANPAPITTMGDLFNRYALEVMPEKAAATQKTNLREISNLRAVFGKMRPADLTAQDIYGYLDARGRTAKTRANREVALLAHILRKAVRWGVLAESPAVRIEKHREKKRERDVTLDEYAAVYALAPDVIQIAMDLAVITGLRQGDLLKLRLQDLSPDGLTVRTGKTGRRLLFELTPGLSDTIERAKRLRRRVSTLYLIANRNGQPYTDSGFRAMWRRVTDRAIAQQAIRERFRWHDLRAVAAKLAEDPQALLGHTSRKQTETYLRGPRRVRPTR